MRKLRVGTPRPDTGTQSVDAPTHLATLREWRMRPRPLLGVTPSRRCAPTGKNHPAGDIDFVQVNYSLAEPEGRLRLLAAAATAAPR